MSVIKNSLYGFVVGDAIGVPIEFELRRKLMANPVTSMLGYGSYDVPEGTWSDDTSMTLATMDSIIKKNGEIDCNDMADRFCNWINNSEYTATNDVVDIGITTKYALIRYWENKTDATKCGGKGIDENGNGSLMRMLPIALFSHFNNLNDNELLNIIKNVSSITHAHEISIMGCYIYVKYVLFLLLGFDKFESYNLVKELDYGMFSEETRKVYFRIIKYDIFSLDLSDVQSTGYVVETLEAVLWVIFKCNSFNESIIGAINLGGDTDTIGAISGSIAGILYGYNNINKKWLEVLKNKEYLDKIIYEYESVFSKK